ncbi:MAG: helix-turn-helix transcriptional regulator [Myxococcota bacterium]|nr:helix-turn-helix transcriptional regulator [Myxococcota bacterium]
MPNKLAVDAAEIALESTSQATFRYAFMERLCRELALDTACMNSTSDGATISLHGHGVREYPLRTDVARYMSEMTVSEMRQACCDKWISDAEVFSPARRDRLSLYREFLRSHAMRDYAGRMWIQRNTCFWITCSRVGLNHRLGSRELAILDEIQPIIAVGEALHATAGPTHSSDRGAYWLRQRRVTQAEARVVNLAQRGLTNAEVANILGTSPRTVRNQMGSVFRKVGVCNRTELLFMMTTADGADGPAGAHRAAAICELLATPNTRDP